MANGSTTNYSLIKPEVGSDNNAWGTHLNTNMDTLDTTIKDVSDVANGVTSVERAASSAGYIWTVKTTGISNKSGFEQDGSNNIYLELLNGAGVSKVKLLTSGNGYIKTPVARTGFSDGSTAAAGEIGEILAASRAFGSAQALGASGVPQNLLASPLVVTAGEWDIEATVGVNMSGLNNGAHTVQAGISLTSATLPSLGSDSYPLVNVANPCGSFGAGQLITPIPPLRVRASGNTNVYIVVGATVTSWSTFVFWGLVRAKRVR